MFMPRAPKRTQMVPYDAHRMSNLGSAHYSFIEIPYFIEFWVFYSIFIAFGENNDERMLKKSDKNVGKNLQKLGAKINKIIFRAFEKAMKSLAF